MSAAAPYDVEVDVLVVGAGGCGLVAALAAAEAGCEVAVLEKAERLRGNTMLSSGSIPAAGTRFQREAGVEDNPERFTVELCLNAGRHDAEHLVPVLAKVSARLVEWLVDRVGVELTLVRTYRHVGHGVNRLHAPPSRRGADLMAGLEKAAELRGIPIAFSSPVTDLIVEDGAVRGALVRNADGTTSRIGAAVVILATNGFGANRALVARHCPSIADAAYAGSPCSEGEALIWGEALGAATGNLGAYQAHASLADPHGVLVTWTVVEKGGIVVDATGRRFADESLGYSAFAAEELAQERPCHVVYDEEIAAAVETGQPEFAELSRMGGAVRAEDAAALALRLGFDHEAFAETLATARAAASGAEDRFGRTSWGAGPLGKRLRATRIAPALFHTQGGLMVDEQARVLRCDGTPVAGLYAGGGAATGISGREGGSGYSSGNGLLSALGLGFVAGRAAAAACRESIENTPLNQASSEAERNTA